MGHTTDCLSSVDTGDVIINMIDGGALSADAASRMLTEGELALVREWVAIYMDTDVSGYVCTCKAS
jgi:hypothetical protein